jgi:hypothetical protein
MCVAFRSEASLERIFDPSPPGSAGTLSRKGRGLATVLRIRQHVLDQVHQHLPVLFGPQHVG